MNARIIVVALVAAVIGGVVGVLGYTWVVGGSGEASAPIAAPTLDVNAIPTLNPTQAFAAVTQVAELSTQVAELQSEVDTLNAAAQSTPEMETTEAVMEEATEEAEIAEATEEPPVVEATGTRNLYRINGESSEVTFFLQEDLRGVRTDVVGTTNEVAGDIILDFANPSASQMGTIRINARTLATDSEFRNRALRAEILQSSSDDYEFIEFAPTAINGIPDSIEVGETYPVEIVGDLTIAGQSNPATFTADVTIDSEEQISGTATAIVLYADWGISIPNAPGVANVTEEVTLTLDFVADQVSE